MQSNLPRFSSRHGLRSLLALAGLVLLPGTVLAQDSFRFVVFGDTRTATCKYDGPAADCINVKVVDKINKAILELNPKPAFVIANGDLARFGETRFYQAFADVMKPIKEAGIPVYVVKGNHELHTEDAQTNKIKCWLKGQEDFQKFFSDMPQNGPKGYEGLAYRFHHGNSYFLILDTFYQTSTTIVDQTCDTALMTPDQLAWSDGEIAKANADATFVHKFAISHAPIFSSKNTNYFPYTQEMWTGFDNSGFDSYFASHEHVYARLKVNELVGRSSANPDAGWQGNVFHVITGAGGGPLDPNPAGVQDLTQSQFGYTVVEVQGKDVTVNTYNYDSKQAIDSFTVHKHTMTVAKNGTGSGAVLSGQPVPYVNCGSTCTAHFNEDALVTLTATPDANSIFLGWLGACWGVETTCAVKMRGAMNVTATFGAKPALVVRRVAFGNDTGTVTAPSVGLDCGPTCSVQTNPGAKVVLKATPGPGSRFTEWGGACSGTQDTCELEMGHGKNVRATFGVAP